jgi:phosphate transport system substrate-binding protein
MRAARSDEVVENGEVAPLEAGAVVGGEYRIVRALAGGRGSLYEAEHRGTGVLRTLEVTAGPSRSDGGLRARFVREMRLAASIPSEHVAQITDAGQDPVTGALYVVMEHLEGSTLASTLESQGAFSWASALAILGPIADALRAAHARGVVHRDLLPESVFLLPSQRAQAPFAVKVIGFGLAKALSLAGEGPPTGTQPTPWIAPQLRTQTSTLALGPPADLWAFGMLAFTVLTGRPYLPRAISTPAPAGVPSGDSRWDTSATASERAAQFDAADHLPARFDAWFARCVDRDPQRRFEDAASAFESLAALRPPAYVEPQRPAPASVRPPPVSEIPVQRHVEPVAAPPQKGASPPRIRPSWLGPAFVGFAGVVGAVVAVLFVLLVLGARPRGTGATAAAAETTTAVLLRLHGSNTIGAELAPALAEAFLRRRTGATVAVRRLAPDQVLVEARQEARVLEAIEIEARGSATAFEDLGAGLCDVGMSSRRIHDDEATKLARLGELTSAASEYVVALGGIAIIVNPANPVSSLAKARIADIFAGEVRRWSDVGGRDEPIVVHARDDRSGTYDTFKHLLLAGRPLLADAKRHESSEELSDAVAADVGAIGFIGLPYVRSAKAVMVQEEGSVALLPSPMTVSTEDYPLTRRLYLYLPRAAPVAARDFVDFAQSEEGQTVVHDAGFVDLRPECDPKAAQGGGGGAPYRELLAGACRISTDFRFQSGSAQLDTRALRDLQRVTATMDRPEFSAKSIVLLGFADAHGTRAANIALSQERAGVVARQLRARGLHVAVERGWGAEMPVSDNATEEGRERNRRVEVWVR